MSMSSAPPATFRLTQQPPGLGPAAYHRLEVVVGYGVGCGLEPAGDEWPRDGLLGECDGGVVGFPPRLGGRTYGGWVGTVAPCAPPVTANLIPAMPPLLCPTSVKCRAPGAFGTIYDPAAAAAPLLFTRKAVTSWLWLA